jgi:hypothetical protein
MSIEMERVSVFFVDSKDAESGLMRAAIEGSGNVRVYNFFDLKEIFLYLKLQPKAIFYYQLEEDPANEQWLNSLENEMGKHVQMDKVHLVGIKTDKKIRCESSKSARIIKNCISSDGSFTELMSKIRKIVAN